MRYVWNPDGFNPLDFLPRSLHRQGDAARALVHLIEYRRLDKRHKADEWVTLQAKYLRNVVGVEHCEAIRDALAGRGVISVLRNYTVGRKSFEFKIGPLFETHPFRRFLVTDKFLVRRMNRHLARTRPDPGNPVHLRLFDWLATLTIEADRARSYVSESGRGPDWVRQKRLTIDMLAEGDWWFTSDRYRRVHTNFTNLWSGLRRFLCLHGQPLVELDIANSQPLFFWLLAVSKWLLARQGRAWGSTSMGEKNSSSVTNINYQSLSFPTPPPTPSLYDAGLQVTIPRATLPADLSKYLALVERGDFYEHLMDNGGFTWADRGRFKDSFFQHVFYAKKTYPNAYASVFGREFPTAYQVLTNLKANEPRDAPRKMQQLEADFVIDTCCRKLVSAHPEVPILTLHDGIWTTPDHLGLVRKTVETEFARLGVYPRLRCRAANGADLATTASVHT